MPRSAGITVSAVLVLIGSVLTIIFGALMAVVAAVMPHSGPIPGVPFNLSHVLVAEAIVVFGFGIWGVASGVGLLNTKQWARISLLIYATLLALVSIPTSLVMAVLPFPDTHDPNLSSNFMSIFRFGMSLFYAAFAALGGFWLYFFNTKNVKAEFRGLQRAVQSSQGLTLGPSVAAESRSDDGRPVSITIIGWFLLVGSAIAPLGFVFFHGFFSGVRLPLFFLGFFFYGARASIIFVIWMVAQLVAAVGLLKLKNWARLGTIGLQCLTLANGMLMLCIPSNRARFQQLMETVNAAMRLPAQQTPSVLPAWAGLAGSLPIACVILWFLIREKPAFSATSQ